MRKTTKAAWLAAPLAGFLTPRLVRGRQRLVVGHDRRRGGDNGERRRRNDGRGRR